MSAQQAFRVLTEFKFEVGQALTASSGLQGKLDEVSNSAQNLQFQLARVGVGFAASLGLVGGGLVGVLGQALKQFNDLEAQQIKIGGIFFANKGFLDGINTANDALKQSSGFLKEVAKQADKFGLNEGALAQFAALGVGITAKEGISPQQNIGFGRNILKAAPQLGINAFDAQGQITRALLGGASQGDPAFRAVTAETTVFKDFSKKIGGMSKVTKEFNKLPLVERFNMLNTAFGQFTQNAELLDRQANTIPALFMRIQQNLFGLNGVFKPLGEFVAGPMKEALRAILDLIKNSLAPILKNGVVILKQMIPNLETAIIRLQQFSDLAGNFKAAGFGALILTTLPFIARLGVMGKLFKGLGKGLGMVAGFIARSGGAFVMLGKVFGFLASSVARFFPPVLALLTLLDVFSRARAIAKIEDAKALPGIMANFSETAALLGSVMSIILKPFNAVLNWAASIIAPIFKVSFLLDVVQKGFDKLATVLIDFFGILSGLTNILVVPIAQALEGNIKAALGAFSPENIKQNYNTGRDDFFKSVLRGAGRDEGGNLLTSGVTQNIAKVEVRQEFKEKLEPDRVAFTLVNTLKKIGQNKTQASGRSFATVGQGN